MPGAVAVELMHNFSLLHDDIIDGDRQRRHRPTVWALFGVGQAIIVGDALQTLAHQVLLDDGRMRRLAAGHRLADAMAAMIAGQADDMALETEERVGVGRVRADGGGKTGCAARRALRRSAPMLAGGDARHVAALADFGAQLGLSFQAVDDVLGIWGDPPSPASRSAPTSRRRRRRCRWRSRWPHRATPPRELQALFRNGNLDEAAVRRATDLIERAGGRDATEEFARAHLDAALAALDTDGARPASRRGQLRLVAEYVCERQL